jgi:hypothetical protein
MRYKVYKNAFAACSCYIRKVWSARSPKAARDSIERWRSTGAKWTLRHARTANRCGDGTAFCVEDERNQRKRSQKLDADINRLVSSQLETRAMLNEFIASRKTGGNGGPTAS